MKQNTEANIEQQKNTCPSCTKVGGYVFEEDMCFFCGLGR